MTLFQCCDMCMRQQGAHRVESVGHQNAQIYFVGAYVPFGMSVEDVVIPASIRNAVRSLCRQFRLRYGVVMPCGASAPSTHMDVSACAEHIMRDIARVKPDVVVGFGALPLRAFWGESDIAIWHGRCLATEISGHRCWFLPTFDESSISADRAGALQNMALRTVECALRYVGKRPEFRRYDEHGQRIVVCRTVSDFVHVLSNIGNVCALDIETSALRPYGGGRILSVAIASDDIAVVSLWEHHASGFDVSERRAIGDALRRFLEGRVIVAHNAPFEMEWLAYRIGRDVLTQDWHCTMNAAHVLDSRGAFGLDILYRMFFGHKLKPTNIDVANLESTNIDTLLNYNVGDAIGTYALWRMLKEQLRSQRIMSVYDARRACLPSLVCAQLTGVVVDIETARRIQHTLHERIVRIESEIHHMKEVAEFERRFNRTFSPTSTRDVHMLVTHILNRKVDNADSETLEALANDVTRAVLEHRALNKLLTTYIEPVLSSRTVWPDGRLHTQYSTTRARTGRLASDGPNMQNWPHRQNAEIRSVIRAPEGMVIVSADYGQIEARILCAASGDPVLLRSIREGYDIHGAWAERLARAHSRILHDYENDMKKLRSAVKAGWCFAQFYGCSQDTLARRWQFDVRRLCAEFWEEFRAVRLWQEHQLRAYRRCGYVESLSGRRRFGPLTRNMVLNTPIQATAADIVMDAGRRLFANGISFVLNIHDDLTFYVSRRDVVDRIVQIADIMVDVRPFPWLTVPLSVSISVGTDWAHMEEVGVYTTQEL